MRVNLRFLKNKNLFALLFIVLLSLFGCKNNDETPEAVYLIKAGEHSSNVEGSLPSNGVRSLKSEVLEFTARFDESAIYDLNNNNQADVNKLFGYSDCNSHHQDNSARFGWNFNTTSGQVDIYSYVYTNGDRTIELLGSTDIDETLVYRLSLSGDNYIFEFKDTTLTIARGSQCNIGLYYLLFPYFGGDEPAPHDIRIYIKERLI